MLRPLSREASFPVEPDRVGDRFLLTWRGKLTAASLLAGLTWLAGVIQDLLLYRGSRPDFSHKIWFLDVDVEQSAFTWISVVALFSAAAILLHNADRAISARRRFVWHWYVLAAVFLFLSFDEFGGIHERLSAAIGARFHPTGLLHFAWAAPAGVVALTGFAFFVPFILSFPKRLAILMVVSAVIFLGGSVGLEMVGGKIEEAAGLNNLLYRAESNLEEGMELLGVLLFIYVMLRYRELEGQS